MTLTITSFTLHLRVALAFLSMCTDKVGHFDIIIAVSTLFYNFIFVKYMIRC